MNTDEDWVEMYEDQVVASFRIFSQNSCGKIATVTNIKVDGNPSQIGTWYLHNTHPESFQHRPDMKRDRH